MKTPRRILHLRASNFVGGPEKQLLGHAERERSGAFEIILGTFVGKVAGRNFLSAIEKYGFFSVALPDRMWGRHGAFSGLVRVLRERKIDLLCTHGYKPDVIGTLAARRAGVPVAWFLRGWTGEDWKVQCYEALDKMLLPLATRIVCLSETQAKRVSQRRSLADRLRVVPNSVEPRNISPEQRAFAKRRLHETFNIPQNSSIVAIAGRLSPEKGASDFLRSVPTILLRQPATRFILFGDGPLRNRLQDLCVGLRINSHVHFAGFVRNLGELLPGVNILVNPSLSEEMPNVVLEAMAAELPVVATDVGGLREIAGSEKSIEIVPAGQPSAIACAVIGLLHEPSRAAELGQRAQLRVRHSFSADRQGECLRALYEGLLEGGSPKFVGGDSAAPELGSAERLAGEETERDSSLPFISVITPVRNEEKHLGLVLAGLLRQEYPKDRYEILVVDGDSTDRTREIVQEVARNSAVQVRLLHNPRQLSSRGRNIGVSGSCGELVVFIDGHCHIPSRDLLRDTSQLFAATGADCLCRPQPLTAPGSNWFQQVVADARSSWIGHGLDSTIYSTKLEGFLDPTSSGASYRRRVFDQVGLYDENLDASEDVEFNYRVLQAGLRSYISPRLTIQYQPRGSFSELWKQMVRYGEGRCRFVQLHPEALCFAQVLPALFVLWVLVGGLLTPVSKLAAVAYLTTLGIYSGVVVASSLWLAIRQSWRHLLTGPAVYATIHFGLGFGFLKEAMRFLGRCFSRCRSSARQQAPSQRPLISRTANGREASSGPRTTARAPSQLAELGKEHPTLQSGGETGGVNAFTVDVEDYFHTEAMSSAVSREQWEDQPSRVQSNTLRLLEIMATYDVRGTLFFLGWVAQRFPSLVREAVGLGHEIGCHSYWHRPVNRLTPDEFRADTLRAKYVIEEAAGVRVRGYRAPSFSMLPGSEWATGILAELGFDYDSSIHPIRHDIYDNAAAPRLAHRISGGAILELPIATCRLRHTNLPIGGGGYLRMLPYSYTRWGLSRFNSHARQPAIIYVHPWEIDAKQPRLPASRRSRFRQYTGLSTMESKLTKLWKDFRFAPISTVFEKELTEVRTARESKTIGHARASGRAGSEQLHHFGTPAGGR